MTYTERIVPWVTIQSAVLFEDCRSWINNATNKVFVAGDIIQRPELATTLERIALSPDPEELFYRGNIADALVREIQENGLLDVVVRSYSIRWSA